jgi:hypothetical protein
MSDSLSELLARGICARWEQLQQLPGYDRPEAIARICADLLWGMRDREPASSLAENQCEVANSRA